MKRDANDVAAQDGLDALYRETQARADAAMQASIDEFPTVETLYQRHGGKYEEPIIHGLIRAGEVANFVAPPKAGKSWLGYHMAYCVASGSNFLGMGDWKCEQGPVVILDNELHEKSLAARMPVVREAMGLHRDVQELVRVKDFRGKPIDLNDLQPLFLKMSVLKPKLVIMDALYQFLPEGVNENDNSQMTRVYRKIIHYAQLANTAILVIHHTSKGNQGDKDITDMGAGAQAGARAADNHIAIREHEEDNHYVLECKPRTWPKPAAVTCDWTFPLWWNMADKDPTRIKGKKPTPADRPAPRVPPEFDETGMLPVLTHDWKPQPLVIDQVMGLHKLTKSAGVNYMYKILTKYQLFGLMPMDGTRDCGLFEVKMIKSLMFRLKGKS